MSTHLLRSLFFALELSCAFISVAQKPFITRWEATGNNDSFTIGLLKKPEVR